MRLYEEHTDHFPITDLSEADVLFLRHKMDSNPEEMNYRGQKFRCRNLFFPVFSIKHFEFITQGHYRPGVI